MATYFLKGQKNIKNQICLCMYIHIITIIYILYNLRNLKKQEQEKKIFLKFKSQISN